MELTTEGVYHITIIMFEHSGWLLFDIGWFVLFYSIWFTSVRVSLKGEICLDVAMLWPPKTRRLHVNKRSFFSVDWRYLVTVANAIQNDQMCINNGRKWSMYYGHPRPFVQSYMKIIYCLKKLLNYNVQLKLAAFSHHPPTCLGQTVWKPTKNFKHFRKKDNSNFTRTLFC